MGFLLFLLVSMYIHSFVRSCILGTTASFESVHAITVCACFTRAPSPLSGSAPSPRSSNLTFGQEQRNNVRTTARHRARLMKPQNFHEIIDFEDSSVRSHSSRSGTHCTSLISTAPKFARKETNRGRLTTTSSRRSRSRSRGVMIIIIVRVFIEETEESSHSGSAAV